MTNSSFFGRSISQTSAFVRMIRILPVTAALLSTAGWAQTAAAPAATTASGTEETVVQLPSFEVQTSRDVGYLASNSVSATRINVPIIDLPFAISAFTPQFMADTGARNLFDVVSYSAGVKSGGTEFLQGDTSYMIRGFAQYPLHDGIYESPQGNVYVDTVAIDRVEVVKGPASLLYGQIFPGGAVNYITKRAKDTPFATTTLTTGSYDYQRVKVDVNQPLVPGKLLFRVNAGWENYYEYVNPSKARSSVIAPTVTWKIAKNLSLTVNYQYFRRNETPPAIYLPATAVATPASMVTAFKAASGYPAPADAVAGKIGLSLSPFGSIDVDQGYNDSANTGWVGIPSFYPKRFNFASAHDTRKTELGSIHSELNATLGSHWVARADFDYNYNSVTQDGTGFGAVYIAPPNSLVFSNGAWAVAPSWSTLTAAQQTAATAAFVTQLNLDPNAAFQGQNGSESPLVISRRPRHSALYGHNVTGQFEAAGNYSFAWGKIKPLIGLYFDRTYINGLTIQNRGNATSLYFRTWDINPASPTYYIDYNTSFFQGDLTSLATQNLAFTSDQAAYAVLNASFLHDSLFAVAGARYNRSQSTTTNYLGTTASAVYGTGLKSHYTTPQVGIGYKITPDLMVYASYATSYNLPSQASIRTFTTVNGLPTSAPTEQAKPTVGEGYEVGLKTELFDRRVSSTLAVYQIEQRNILNTVTQTIQGVTIGLDFQGTTVRSRGIEYELTYTPVRNWQIFASVADDDVRAVQEPPGYAYYLGETPYNTTRYLANLWTRYNFAAGSLKGLWIGGGAKYTGRMLANQVNKFYYNPAYTDWSSVIGYDWTWNKKNFTLALNWQNMANTLEIPAQQTRGLPERVTLSLTGNF